MKWFKKKTINIEIEKIVQFNFKKNSDGDVILSIYRQSRNDESRPYFLHDKFQVKRGDDIHTNWNIDILKEELIKIIDSLD